MPNKNDGPPKSSNANDRRWRNKNSQEEKERSERRKPSNRPWIGLNLEKALKYGLIACDLGNYHSCANVSRMYELGHGVKKDEEKSKEYRQKAKDIADSVGKK